MNNTTPRKPKPDKVRKAEERKLKRANGLVPMEVWVKPQHKNAIKSYAQNLNDMPDTLNPFTFAITKHKGKKPRH